MASPLGTIQNNGDWYDPVAGTVGSLPVPQQPDGAGTPVTLPLQQPNRFWQSDGIPTNTPPNEHTGPIASPCGHSIVFWAIAFQQVDGVASALVKCPVCGYVQQVVTPASDVFNYLNSYSP